MLSSDRFVCTNLLVLTILVLVSHAMVWVAQAQSIDVPLRYPDSIDITSVTVPGTFNGWQTSGPSMMQKMDSLGQWYHLQTLTAGQVHEYKFFVSTGSGTEWITDPNNLETNPADNNNSVLRVADPALFQPIVRTNVEGLVTHFTVGVMASGSVQSAFLSVGDAPPKDVTSWFDPSLRVLQVALTNPVVVETRFEVAIETDTGSASVSTGSIDAPLALTTIPRRTTEDTFRLRGVATTNTGEVDPDLDQVRLFRNGVFIREVAVSNGRIDTQVDLQPGANRFSLAATIEGVSVVSNDVTLTRWKGPLAERWFDVAVSGADRSFTIELVETAASPGITAVSWNPDERFSTTPWAGFSGVGLLASGSTTGTGDIFVDIEARRTDGTVQQARTAIRIAADGAVSTYDWAETAPWIDQAVVYEIFPLSFGPVEATGSVGNEGTRLREIAQALDYIAAMGFNTIWFMPIMQNLSMDQVGGGYNVIDFRTVDPKLGTNDDFKALVDRAHELGIRIILDLTINHSSPDHVWVQSLTNDGDYPGFVQTSPSAHDQGQDSKGASLPEQWSDNGLYRVYDGFGQLANLNWDNDDLQAEMLDVIAWWLTEFNIDGFRFDAYWGPWRRYGPERFGRPVRELVRRLKPDAWLLGEIEGTGPNTEVYYADAENGTSLAGGLDSAYDWTFSAYLRNPSYYPNTNAYRDRMINYGFMPGPNARLFRFLENHDERRIQEVYNSRLDRVRPLTGLLMTGPGIPMVFQGQEVGYGAGSGDRRRLPVNWTAAGNAEWAALHRLWATARSRFPAFGTQDVTLLDAPSAAMAFVRPWTDQNAVVLINFAASPQTFTIDPSDAVHMSTDGPIPYYDVAADTSAAYSDGFSVELAPYEVVIYITSSDAGLDMAPLPALPFSGMYTRTQAEVGLPADVALAAPWPNPTHGPLHLEWHTRTAGPTKVVLFDLLGREVSTIQSGYQLPGLHSAKVVLGTVAPGVYLVRFQGPEGTFTRSIVVTR